MLARYSIVRGARASELPDGVRQDARKHTKHVLRPTEEIVESVLGPRSSEAAWRAYPKKYRALLEARFEEDRAPFDHIANLARFHDVYIGCNCPTAKQPDVTRCHTVHALRFMKDRYPDLDVRFPVEK